MEGFRINPIRHQNSRPATTLCRMWCQVLNITCIRLQEVRPNHVSSQRATGQGHRTGHKSPHVHTHAQLPPHTPRSRYSNREGPTDQVMPNQQQTWDSSGFREEGQPSDKVYVGKRYILHLEYSGGQHRCGFIRAKDYRENVTHSRAGEKRKYLNAQLH